MNALLLAIECDQFDLARLLVRNRATWSTKEQYPYLAGLSCYLVARQGNGTIPAGDLERLYTSAAKLFDQAIREYETANTRNSKAIAGRNVRSALFIGSSVVLLLTTGGMPIPCALTNERQKEAIANNKIRLTRCQQLKEQCEIAIKHLRLQDANSLANLSSLGDLTLTFLPSQGARRGGR